MGKTEILVILCIFMIGFLSASFLSLNSVEVPLGKVPILSEFGINFSGVSAPSDSVGREDIVVYDDRIVIWVDDGSVSSYAPTGSMEPVLNEGSNGIRIVPSSADEIFVGDIVTFEEESYLIVHRVIDKGVDGKGIYFITKGDNNDISDGKVRFSQIRYKTVGVIW